MSLSPVITSAPMDKELCVLVHSAFSLIRKRISHVDSIQAKAHAHSNKLPCSQYGGELSFILFSKNLTFFKEIFTVEDNFKRKTLVNEVQRAVRKDELGSFNW